MVSLYYRIDADYYIAVNCHRKDYVKKEIALGKLWHRDWGFLPDQYQQVSCID